MTIHLELPEDEASYDGSVDLDVNLAVVLDFRLFQNFIDSVPAKMEVYYEKCFFSNDVVEAK